MSPVKAPIPPEHLKQVLEAYGFRLYKEDEDHWWLVKADDDAPIPIPKDPNEDGNVEIPIMENVLFDAGINDFTYFALKQKLFGENPPDRKN